MWFSLSSLSGPSKNCQSENETRLVPKAGNWSSFQSAIIAARYYLIAYDIATAQSYRFKKFLWTICIWGTPEIREIFTVFYCVYIKFIETLQNDASSNAVLSKRLIYKFIFITCIKNQIKGVAEVVRPPSFIIIWHDHKDAAFLNT